VTAGLFTLSVFPGLFFSSPPCEFGPYFLPDGLVLPPLSGKEFFPPTPRLAPASNPTKLFPLPGFLGWGVVGIPA